MKENAVQAGYNNNEAARYSETTTCMLPLYGNNDSDVCIDNISLWYAT
jgi:hypothetical protein